MKLRHIRFLHSLLFVLGLVAASNESASALPFDGRNPGNKLTASDTADFDTFGASVAISSSLVLVGCPGDNSDRGAVYVYDILTGNELFKLTASDADLGDGFGNSVSTNGNLAIVGASQDDDSGSASGSAYVFDLNTRKELFKLAASDAASGDLFGISVAASGTIAVIGAEGENGAGNNRGAAYVFDLLSGNELSKLTASDAENFDFFGHSVAVSGTLAVVGAYLEDGSGTDRGAAYVYDLTTGTQLFKLAATDTENGSEFGTSVAISPNFYFVSAPKKDGIGAVYAFELATGGGESFKLTASDAANQDKFGASLAVSESQLVVGASGEDGGGNARGATYIFDPAVGAELFKFTAVDAADLDGFGNAVAAFGRHSVSGASFEAGSGTARGAAYVFETPRFQPDNRIGTFSFSQFGNDTYNSSGFGQTLELTSRNLAAATAFLTVTNDGDRGDNFTLRGDSGNLNFGVRYLRQGIVETNITAAMIAGTHVERSVLPEESGRIIRADIAPSSRLRRRVRGRVQILRTTFITRLSSSSEVHPFRNDTVAIQVRTR